MNDPFFEAVVAEIRGFDLGDDEEILAELQARRVGHGSGLSGDDWLLLGVLELRRRNDARAIECFERAAIESDAVSQARYLQAYLWARRGRYAEAESALDLADRASEHDGLITTVALVHARGTLARLRGNSELALQLYREAVELDPTGAWRWLSIAQLHADANRFDDARRALDQALRAEPDSHQAMFELAALAAQNSEVHESCHWLAEALAQRPEARRRAVEDPRFDGIRKAPTFARLFEPPARADPTWIDAIAPWLATLRRDRTLATEGLTWLDRAESERASIGLQREYERGPVGTMHTEATLEYSRTLLARHRLVARGPGSRTREGVEEPFVLFVDIDRPDRLRFAPSRAYPPFLWIDAGTTADELRRALAEFFPRPRLQRTELSACARGFIGYRLQFGVPNPLTGELEPANAAELDRHFAINPFVETASWGSAALDDPWPDDIPNQPALPLKLGLRQQETNLQAPGAVWSISRRTRHSRAYLTIELHHRDLFVVQVLYRPSRQRAVVERLNAHFGTGYPTDLPLDCIGALLGFQFDSATDLIGRLETTSDAEEISGLLLVIAALRHSDLGTLALYRRYVDHPDPLVRATLVNVFAALNYETMLEEMSAIESNEALRRDIENLLDDGVPFARFDPFRDYDVDWQASDGDGEGDPQEFEIELDVESEETQS